MSTRTRIGIPVVAVVTIVVVCWAAQSPTHPASSGTLTEAWRIISSREFVDLTHAFSPSTPVWTGFGPATFAPAADPVTGSPYTLEKEGWHTTQYTLVGQYGTHIDPPAHFTANGATLDQLPLKEMILPLIVFDITPKLVTNPHYALNVSDILQWEKKHGRVPAGSFAALRTDMSKDWETHPERFKRQPFPAWSFEAIRFLYQERGITANGHESMDTDTTEDLKSETWLLHQGHWQIEVLANLDRVPPIGALIVVTWPKPKGGLGFPARAFAILP